MFRDIRSHISGKLVLVLFTVANAVYMAMLIYSIPKLMQYTDGLPLFDMSPLGYSYQEALALLSALGEEERSVYVSLQLTLDLFYPFLFALCYSALLQWLIGVGKLSSRVWLCMAVVPVFVCLFDYAENIGIWFMLTEYPVVSKSLVMTSSVFTLAKSLLTMIYFTGLISVICVIVFRRLFGRTKRAVS
ncbi:hypothetical protein [Vibrio campbellii]|uniref:hypothetical protein n=1 Tax=Vibrio campbellii TaxID=680 RepID=UPI0006831664|nr:hypothetical protein [Vibrio campbellii]